MSLILVDCLTPESYLTKNHEENKGKIKQYVLGFNLIVFVAREEQFTPEEKATFDFICSNFAQDIAPFFMLVIAGCEGKNKASVISAYESNEATKHIVSQMKFGIFPVGFPDLSQYDEPIKSIYTNQVRDDEMELHKMACKAEQLYLNDKLCDD